jgi:hypothetical protein
MRNQLQIVGEPARQPHTTQQQGKADPIVNTATEIDLPMKIRVARN